MVRSADEAGVELPECPAPGACVRSDARIGERSPAFPASETAIDSRQAAWSAAELLTARGVSDIEIFDVEWIAAPLTGFLVNATGVLTLGDARFLSFRLGLRDGFEADGDKWQAGEEFAFMALGYDAEGRQVWSPHPGPIRSGEEEAYPSELLVYEFLSTEDQERLEFLLREASSRP